MNFLILILTWVVCGYLTTRIPLVKKSELGNKLIFFLYSAKVAAGIIMGMIAARFSDVNDYIIIHQDGITEYHQLMQHPWSFITDIFHSHRANGYGGFFSAVGSYWNDLRNTIITKLLAICNIISRGDFNTNIALINVFAITGQVALFRVFDDWQPGKRNWMMAGVFLIPTSLFYTSCVHKDLFVAGLLGLYTYALYFSIKEKMTKGSAFLLIFSFAGILLMRNFLGMVLIPSSLAFMLCKKIKWRPNYIFTTTFGVAIAIVVSIHQLSASPDFFKIITDRQTEFLKLPKANSQIHLTPLEATINSFLYNMPEAISHGFFRPFIWENSNPLVFYTALEWLVLFVIPAILAIFFYRKSINSINPIILFIVALSFCMLLVIGYIVPNTHSIVRYRSIFLPFICTPLLFFWLKLMKKTLY